MSDGQGEIYYTWYECMHDLELDGSQESFLAFFDVIRSEVTKKGEGKHKDKVDWSTRLGTGTIPDYLPINDEYYRQDHDTWFSWAVSGYIYAPKTGSYTFGLSSDDASELYIDEELILNTPYEPHGYESEGWQYTHVMNLSEGFHSIAAKMVNVGGASAFRIGWQKPADAAITAIPKDNYYFSVPSLVSQAQGVIKKRGSSASRKIVIFRKEDGSIMNQGYSDSQGKYALNVEKDVPFHLVVFDELTDDPFQNAKTEGCFTRT